MRRTWPSEQPVLLRLSQRPHQKKPRNRCWEVEDDGPPQWHASLLLRGQHCFRSASKKPHHQSTDPHPEAPVAQTRRLMQKPLIAWKYEKLVQQFVFVADDCDDEKADAGCGNGGSDDCDCVEEDETHEW